jgi:hypothetical protein
MLSWSRTAAPAGALLAHTLIPVAGCRKIAEFPSVRYLSSSRCLKKAELPSAYRHDPVSSAHARRHAFEKA